MPVDLDTRVRLAAFEFLEDRRRLYGDPQPWDVLRAGFPFDGSRIHFVGGQGIFKAAELDLPSAS